MYTPSRTILIAFFRGHIADEQIKSAISHYLAADTDPSFVEECMEAAWTDSYLDNYHYLPDSRHWHEFKMRAGIRRNYLRPILAVAASLALIVALTFTYLTKKPEIAWQKITASPQQVTTATLADGSKVTLFPGSTLQYRERAVILEGRGFFDIAPSAGKPFTVTSGPYTTLVLGTSFDVNEQSQQHMLTVTLVSGKVQLLHQQQSLATLAPNQQIAINTTNQHFNITNAAGSTTAWVTGALNYDQVLLSDVCQELEKWYGVKISIDRSTLQQKHITASFKDMPLSTVMNILSQTAGFHFSQDHNNIHIW